MDTQVGDFRVGQQQMVEIACNLMDDDLKILIMDEPTSSLPKQEVQVLFDIMRELTAQGISIVYIFHRLEEIMQIGGHVMILQDGKYVADADVKDINVPWIVRQMTGEGKSDPKRDRNIDWSSQENILEVKNLPLPKSGGYLLKDVSLKQKKDAIIGLCNGVINDGMVMCGVSEFWQMVIKGLVIVLAVIIDQFQRNLQAKMALRARNESK